MDEWRARWMNGTATAWKVAPPLRTACHTLDVSQPTRRRVLQTVAGAVGWAASSSVRAAAGDDALDEALHRIHACEPACTQGLSTHAPMVVEVLCELGQGDQVSAWLDRYRGPTLELPAAGAHIDPADARSWRAALGPDVTQSSWERANARWRDWVDLFTAELAAQKWRAVLDRWAGRLAPGMSGGATHGVIRTSHAVRGLARRDTAERRAELARGLAYWASSYEEIKPRGARVELDKVPLYWDATGHGPSGRNIVEGLRHVAELEAFPAPPDAQADPAADLSRLTARFAQVYLRHGTAHNTIAFIHAVTGPCSLRRMAPHLQPATLRAALPYAWQAATAIYAAYARRGDPVRRPAPKLSRAELVARALANGNEHAIKFTETLLSEHELHADPVYLAAAEDVVGRI
jgi:hypothetical protein